MALKFTVPNIFFERNSFLTCAAAPIVSATGQLMEFSTFPAINAVAIRTPLVY